MRGYYLKVYNIMILRKLFVLILLAFGLTITGFSQTNTYYQNKNTLSPEDFYNISFNGITLQSIIATKGDPAKVDALFGMSMTQSKSNDPNYCWINFGNGSINLTFDELVGNLDLSGLDVLNKSVAVKIGDKVIHLGDSTDKLGSVKIFTGINTGTKFILFLPQGADGQSLRIDFNPATKTITKITYKAT